MRTGSCWVLIECSLLLGIIGTAQAEPSFELDMDRTGGDYRSFEIPRPRPRLCQDACLHEQRCRSWTFVRPGVLSPLAICWLKGSVPDPQRNPCCVSGMK